jgi:hypothetical protein
MTLIAAHGTHYISREQLANLPVPQPQGPRHYVRPFIEDVETVLDHFGSIGARLVNDQYVVARDPSTSAPRRYYGQLAIALPDHRDESYTLQIGLRGSYDQSISRALGVGAVILVCSNGCFSAEVEFHTKQTLNVNRRIGPMIAGAVARIPALAEAQSAQFDRYRNSTITRRGGDAFLVECVRRGALTPSQLGKALEQWDAPIHPEHGEYGWSLWQLHNAVSESLKNPNAQGELAAIWQRTRILTTFLNETLRADDLPLAA